MERIMLNFVKNIAVENLDKEAKNVHMDNMLDLTCLFTGKEYAYTAKSYPIGRRQLM